MPKYIYEKTRILKQFNIKLTGEQITHITNLKSEIAIDNYCQKIIVDAL